MINPKHFIKQILSNPDPTMDKFFDQQMKTKHGVDKTDLMIRFMPVLEARGSRKLRNSFNRLKSFICQQIKRGITPQEDIRLSEGILKYVQSDPGTNERFQAMDYLFELKFLEDTAN